MTTLNRAMRERNEDDAEIAVRLVCKQLFRGRQATILIMVLVDRDGNAIEAKSFKTIKSHTVYRLFDEGEDLILKCAYSAIKEPDHDYSQAKYETSSRWYLEPNEHVFDQKNHFYCWTDIDKFHNSWRPAKSIAGSFVEMGPGPMKYGPGGQIVAQGQFIKLRDVSDNLFRALVWKCMTKNNRYKFALDDCKKGDCVLLPYAREQDEEYRAKSPSIYTVTTVYPPVVNSKCISPNVHRNLANRSHSSHSDPYNPYKKQVEYCGLAIAY